MEYHTLVLMLTMQVEVVLELGGHLTQPAVYHLQT
jgi:hypothetical protein